MENFSRVLEEESFIEEWHDCYLSNSKVTGFICTFELQHQKHRFYGLNDLKKFLTAANKQKQDLFLSLNAFEFGSRTTAALKQIRNIGIDIDCYKLNISVNDAKEEIKKLIFKGSIPNPNLVILSGRGIQLIYSISGGASPKMAFLSQYITTQFISELRHIGADTSATDVTRVFRLPYSINSKVQRKVTVDLWRTLEYSLLELYSFCTPLEKRRKASKKKRGLLTTLPSPKGLKDLYSLNTFRKNDLELLVSIRKGEIEKRNVLTYIYSYTVALILKNKQATIEFANQLNARFVEPQRTIEVARTAGNAYEDALKFYEEFKNREFRMWYQSVDGIKRPMKNTTIIEELEITSQEMKQLSTVIDKKEKQYRDTKRKRAKSRSEGVAERKEYIKTQHQITDEHLQKLQEILANNPKTKRKELAEALGVSIPRIAQLKQLLKSV